MNTGISKRWGWKLLFIFSSAIFMIGTIISSDNFKQELSAASNSAPTFQMYDKVKLANKEFTVINVDSNISLLSDTDTGSETTWNQATSELTSFSAGLGTIGSSYFNNKFSMPLTNELAITDNQLSASIPNIAKDWWLGDSTSNNRNKFIDKNNRTDGEVTLKKTIINESNSCDVETVKENGVKISSVLKDADLKGTGKANGTTKITLSSLAATIYYYSDYECKSQIKASSSSTTPAKISQVGSSAELNVTFKDGKIDSSAFSQGNGNFLKAAVMYRVVDNNILNVPISNISTRFTVKNQCLSFENTTDLGYAYASTNSWSSSIVKAMKIAPDSKNDYIGIARKQPSGSSIEGTFTCTGQTHPAGTSYVRPKVSISTSDIVWGGNAKRTYAVGSQIKDSFPTSEGNTYLTLRTDAMSAGLTGSAEGVEGTTITVKRPQDGIVKLPISVSGKQEGTQYLGASMNVGGSEKYNVLKQVNVGDHEVSLDITNISNYDKLSELPLTLYVEDEGSYDTSYMSNGTEITIVFEEDVVDEIPEDWIIVSPDANAYGWNNGPVTISLSEEAKTAGYTLEVVNDANVVQKSGNVITYESETDGSTPKVRLRKGEATTNVKQVREIKIDTTKPTASIAIENESEWAVKKQLTIQPNDARSGVDTVVVKEPDGQDHTISMIDDTYTYDATVEGSYTITISDKAGNFTVLTKQISKIDTTSISLTAQKETLETPQPKQKITLTYQAGASGISTFKVFYKQGNEEYTYLENITVSDSPMDWYAEMNGWFKFELINKAGEKAEAEVEIVDVNPPKPVTKIHAVYQDDTNTNYKSGTWTKHNIVITLSNANAEISDPVIFEYSEDNGTTWNTVSDDILIIETDTTLEKSLLFRSKVSEDVKEGSTKSFIVKIDKTKPLAPNIIDEESYTKDTWYQDNVTVETQITPKDNQLSQEVYVCIGTKAECSLADANWTKTVDAKKEISGNGSYELYFKAMDEAGNESELSKPAYVNINNEAPVITISLKQNPIKSLIHDLTFGFFYKESVDVDIAVDFSPSGIEELDGEVYYFIDTENKGKPEKDSVDWTQGTHETIDPQAKAMIYVKAVSSAGVIAYEDSIFHVYVDTIAPTITLPNDMEDWTTDTFIEVTIADEISGIDKDSVKLQIGMEAEQGLSLKNGKAKITNLPNGAYNVLVKASDYSENAGLNTVKVKIDNELPQIKEPSADSDEWQEQKTISFDVQEQYSGIESVVVKDSKGTIIEVTPQEQGTYSFLADKNDTYTITVSDKAGNVSERSYTVENIIGDTVSKLQVVATHKGQQIASETWVNEEILFTISGGLDIDTLEKYQVAITDGEAPEEGDWEDINLSATHQHKVSGNVNGKSYWFRVVPTNLGVEISEPFIVNLDSLPPTDVTIETNAIHTDPIARMINLMSFGEWMKKAQRVSVTAQDNFTPSAAIRYEYAEEKDGVLGQWQAMPTTLDYEETDIVLYVRAIDLAGNVSEKEKATLLIDTTPPVIEGVKDQDIYKKYYYVYRTITYHDEGGSGIDEDSAIIKCDGIADTLVQAYKVKEFGSYEVSVKDIAGNEAVVHFQLVPLPDIETEIDGSDESKDIIDQIQKELDEERENLTPDEIKDYEKWIEDAEKKWENERKKKLEDKETGTIVEGEGNTSFDPNTILVVDEIDESKIPELPRKAIQVFDVYMKKGETIIQPDGSVKVYLPYTQEEEPIIYEIDEHGNVKEIKGTKEDGYVSFITDTLEKYAISNTAQEENKEPEPDNGTCSAGPDGKLGTEDDVCGEGNGKDEPTKNEDGSVDVPDGGTIHFPDKEIEAPDGAHINPDGSVVFPDGTEYDKDGNEINKEDPIRKDCPLDGKSINIDTDKDNLPDINLDIDNDCKADLNIDVNGNDAIPDLNIDTIGDGKANINIDTDGDGYADINIMLKLIKWEPSFNTNVNGFAYDTMIGLVPDLNVDEDGDGKPDRNIDTDNDGLPDVNVDEDWFTKRGIKDPSGNVQTGTNNAMGGAMTGDSSKWIIWWILLIITCSTMMISHLYKRRKQHF